MQLALIALFGLVGIFSRYAIDLLTARLGFQSHWGTFAINLLGSLLVTLIYVLGAERNLISTELRTALLVGMMGGFTTFSSYSLQSALLAETGAPSALVYAVLSPVAGIALALGGLHLFRAIFPL